MTINKTFVTPHLDYDEVIYGEALWLLGSIGSCYRIVKGKTFPRIMLGIPPKSMLVQENLLILSCF